ncbi:MAG: hypothetical protein H7835_07285 [Magnetococcus sp. XQGC-1]
MNDDQSEPLQRLLLQIARHRDESCQQILQAANAQAAEWIASAKAEAKRRVSIAKKAEKERLAEAQATLKARQATELRQQQLRQTQAMLEQGWTLLLESVTRHWEQPELRAIWLSNLAQRAAQLFANGTWTIRHPPQWHPQEWGTLHPESRFQADPDLTAGLCIGCQGAWLDGSLQGMMANRQALSALLLAQLERDEK